MISLPAFASSLPSPSIRVPSLPSLPSLPAFSLPTSLTLPAALQRSPPSPPPLSAKLLAFLTRYLLLYPSLLLLALIFALSFSSYLLSALHDYDTHVKKSRLKMQRVEFENTVKPAVVKDVVEEVEKRNPQTPPPPSVAMKMVVGELVGRQRREQEEEREKERRMGMFGGLAGCGERGKFGGLDAGVIPVGRGVWVE